MPQKPIKGKNTESSRELLERTLGKTLPNHEVQVNFSVFFLFVGFFLSRFEGFQRKIVHSFALA